MNKDKGNNVKLKRGVKPRGDNKEEWLFHAILEGDKDLAINFIKSGANVLAIEEGGRNALLLAISCNQKEVIEFLVNDDTDKSRFNYLKAAFHAFDHGLLDMGKYFIESISGIREDPEFIEYMEAAFINASYAYPDILKYVYQFEGVDIDVNRDDGIALRAAAMDDDLTSAKYLIEIGAKIDIKRINFWADDYDFGINWETPLIVAAKNANSEVANLLIENDADIYEGDGAAFKFAVVRGYKETAMLFVNKDPEYFLSLIAHSSDFDNHSSDWFQALRNRSSLHAGASKSARKRKL